METNQANKQKISVIIPVLNEEASVGKVLADLPEDFLENIVVVDNGSTDNSIKIASEHGALVLQEQERGYGAACLKGIQYLVKNNPPDILVFLDGDYSDYPEEIVNLVDKINEGYDFVLGSRVLGIKKYHATLSAHSVFGNQVAAFFLKIFFDGKYTDLGPFRAIKFEKLLELKMVDRNYGWTIEMQIKAERAKLKVMEIPVHYRKRYGGKSKVTGNFWGSFRAFFKITYVTIIYFFRIK